MDDRLILYQQRQIRDLKAERDQAQQEADEWRHRAEAIYQEYMLLRDQIRRGAL
jgi:hypothetical protein